MLYDVFVFLSDFMIFHFILQYIAAPIDIHSIFDIYAITT